MRNFIKYISIVFIAGGLFTACETTELDLRVSPNDLAADQADPNLLLNSIQLAYATNQQTLSDRAAELTRIDYFFGRDYFNQLPGNTLNGVWSRTYSSGGNGAGDFVSIGILTNLQNLEAIDAASETDYSFHIGVAKTLYAHSLIQLVDFLGQAAFSQAGNPAEFPAPTLDDGQAVYTAALGLLDEASSALSSGPATQGAADIFYGGDTAQWVRLINSIRLLAYKNTGDVAAFNGVISGGNFITDSADDFQLTYGTSELQPDDRHPDFAADYTPSGANIYQSNWLMELMLNNNDPRIRYYFYRQRATTPGADEPPNEETLACSLVVPPQHYQDGGFTYCSVPNGYWGRSHGNDEGTPPDNFLRAAVGVYPAGGRFDDNSFGNVGLGLGGGGAGIEPIILASYIDFWRGQMAASDAARSGFLRDGLTKSIAKVQTFGALDGGADTSFAPDAAAVTAYVDGIVAAFDAATGDDKENIYAEQYFTTLFGGGTDAFNYYRQTGFPTTVLPNWELNPGPFPRTFLLPQNEVINNPNLDQRTDLTTQVFWDNNPASPTFPPAN
ncbi:SusD/RagB family nutrient-binding outer membrane lipoprotein [Flagellimonas sp. DF-77]|uniref:SusD/RagB family nutrient-binding outer membrane lipoprotein n=1 Tax=Flagellimonas algarum TaxID=3230298 RepID=UPI003396E5E1